MDAHGVWISAFPADRAQARLDEVDPGLPPAGENYTGALDVTAGGGRRNHRLGGKS